MQIRPGDFSDPQVIDLLRLHLAGMHAASPPGSVHALDLSGLKRPDISFFTVWDGDALMGCGALRALSPEAAEIKSMRTHPEHLHKGVGAVLLRHLLAEARTRGHTRVSLETGSGPTFAAALHLYRAFGFTPGPAFGDYVTTEFNQFLHLDLTPDAA
ncbi:GNAT family N-acetyltransferase [Segnochrobactraceae bacterium EtOH-i3]